MRGGSPVTEQPEKYGITVSWAENWGFGGQIYIGGLYGVHGLHVPDGGVRAPPDGGMRYP